MYKFMKNNINQVLVLALVAQIVGISFGTAFAQSYDNMGGFSGGSETTSYGWYEQANPNVGASYYNMSNYYYPDASTYYGTQSCIGCDSGYTAPAYTAPSYTSPVYTSPTYTNPVYTTPSYTYPTYTNSGYTYPAYTAPVYTAPIPTTNSTVCSDGQLPSPTTGCNRTTTIPVTNNTICADGFTPTNGSCTRTNTIPVTNTTVCSDGQLPSHTTGCNRVTVVPTVQYQTCWDGSIIPTNSICLAQFKVCANGTSIPVNQTCYVAHTPVYVPPTLVKFNNVVTSVVTQITQTSGRCNGIGLIANNAQSSAWFEYGETTGLGRTTATASIGSSNTAPFSNVLANLKPSTRYYCRAVMQNQYGLVKGEIVGFTTASRVTTYVKPVVITKKPIVKTPVKTNEVLCVDGTKVTVKNQSSATLINEGQKLITLSIEKTEGKIASGETVKYKINFKNLSDTRLTGILIKVVLPQEVKLMSANIGSYDEVTRTLTLNQEGIDPYTEGTILLTGTIVKDAALGKTIITNAYALYTLPGTQTQDEVTAYVIGSIVPQTELTKEDTGVKNVVGASSVKSFMPNSLIEWLALLAILFIIFILGRSIYASYKEDEGKHH